MAAIIVGTEAERGPTRWRVQTSGFNQEGPLDKTLVIKFNSILTNLPGFDGRLLNIAELREACIWARQDWIPAEGNFQCSVSHGSITVIFI